MFFISIMAKFPGENISRKDWGCRKGVTLKRSGKVSERWRKSLVSPGGIESRWEGMS
jgi:hypothetical protein